MFMFLVTDSQFNTIIIIIIIIVIIIIIIINTTVVPNKTEERDTSGEYGHGADQSTVS